MVVIDVWFLVSPSQEAKEKRAETPEEKEKRKRDKEKEREAEREAKRKEKSKLSAGEKKDKKAQAPKPKRPWLAKAESSDDDAPAAAGGKKKENKVKQPEFKLVKRPVVPGDTTVIPPTPAPPEAAEILRAIRILAMKPRLPSAAGEKAGAAAVGVLRLRAEAFAKKDSEGVDTVCGKARAGACATAAAQRVWLRRLNMDESITAALAKMQSFGSISRICLFMRRHTPSLCPCCHSQRRRRPPTRRARRCRRRPRPRTPPRTRTRMARRPPLSQRCAVSQPRARRLAPLLYECGKVPRVRTLCASVLLHTKAGGPLFATQCWWATLPSLTVFLFFASLRLSPPFRS